MSQYQGPCDALITHFFECDLGAAIKLLTGQLCPISLAGYEPSTLPVGSFVRVRGPGVSSVARVESVSATEAHLIQHPPDNLPA